MTTLLTGFSCPCVSLRTFLALSLKIQGGTAYVEEWMARGYLVANIGKLCEVSFHLSIVLACAALCRWTSLPLLGPDQIIIANRADERSV